jgi:hypothetical protein
MKKRSITARLCGVSVLVAMLVAVPVGPAYADARVRPMGGPYAGLAAQVFAATLGPCLAAHPGVLISVSITIEPGFRVRVPVSSAWAEIRTANVTLLAVVTGPSRVPKVVSTSTMLASGWVWGPAGTLSLDPAIGPEVIVRLALEAASRVPTAMGCPGPVAPVMPIPTQLPPVEPPGSGG